MKYFIDNVEVDESKFERELTEAVYEGTDYDEVLDEIEGDVVVAGLTFSASQIIYELDETAYRTMKNDYVDGVVRDLMYDLDDDTELEYKGKTFTTKSDDEDEEEDDE